MDTTVVLLAILVVGFAAISGRIQRSILTGPMLFTAIGLLLGGAGLDVIRLDVQNEGVSLLAEATLVLVLFTDAARIDLPRLRTDAQLPVRMLASLILVIAMGTLAALALFPGLPLFEAAVLAAVLAPTDAALGQAVVTDPRLPLRIRQTLNVESGLNDGIILPFVTIFLGLAGAEEGVAGVGDGLSFIGRQVGFGVLVGLIAGCLGAWIIDTSSNAGWMTDRFQQVATLACGVAAFAGAEAIGGNGFIAAFVGGMAFGAIARHRCGAVYAFAEEEGSLLTLLVFAILGASLAPGLLQPLDLATVGYVLLSLTVVRMLPIALSLIGTGLRPESVAFLGWFGPRGLASILFALLVVERIGLQDGGQIVSIALWTVLASVLLHGLSAVPLVGLYTTRLQRNHRDDMPEMQETTAFHTR